MNKKAEIGKRYRVISDDMYFFKQGDIVVSLENHCVPYCVLEDVFIKRNGKLNVSCYDLSEVSALTSEELEDLEESKECQKLEISKMLTISTKHITPEADESILYAYYDDDKDVSAHVYTKDNYGWFVYIDEDFENKTNLECLKDCMRFARKNGCDLLCLDCDGPVVDGLPVYEW